MKAARLFGSETPRLFTPPLRDLTPATSKGFEAIWFAEHVLGIELFPWQKWLLIHLLELRPDGNFRFRVVLIMVARQNGKSTLLQMLTLWFMYAELAGMVIGTAQNLDVAEEVWEGAVEMAEGVPELAAEIRAVTYTNGKKQLRLKTGPRYRVQAANRRGGRGLTGDVILLDELREQRTWDAWAAVSKTTTARPNAMILAASNAGDHESVVLNKLRSQALPDDSAVDDDDLGLDTTVTVESVGLFEWSAPEGCALDDWEGIALANPSLGWTIDPDTIRTALATDPEHVFRTETLCQFVPEAHETAYPVEQVQNRMSQDVAPTGNVQIAVDASPNGESGVIVACGTHMDGLPALEIIEHADGIGWLPDRVAQLVTRWSQTPVIIDPAGPAAAIIPQLAAAGVPLKTVTARDLASACGGMAQALSDGQVWLRGHDAWLPAVQSSRRRTLGDGWALTRRSGGQDISPLVAGVLALWGWRGRADVNLLDQIL